MARVSVKIGLEREASPVENYASDPRGDDPSYIAQHTLTLFLRRTVACVKRSNDNRRSIEWPRDTDVVRLIRPGTCLVTYSPPWRQSCGNPVLAPFRTQHPLLEPGAGVRRKNLTEKHGTQ